MFGNHLYNYPIIIFLCLHCTVAQKFVMFVVIHILRDPEAAPFVDVIGGSQRNYLKGVNHWIFYEVSVLVEGDNRNHSISFT